MQLLSFRILGHPAIPEVSWLNVGRGVTIIKTDSRAQAEGLINMLQTINPPYDLNLLDPFSDLPQYTVSNHYRKKIIAGKKTAALAFFAASPRLVKELSAIDPAFYETDRIEVGRRRDRSRWMNFVELPGSIRWDEIAPSLRKLLANSQPEATVTFEELQNAMAKLHSTDRIKGQVAAELRKQLETLHHFLSEQERGQLAECLFAIDRAQRFQQAKARVDSFSPLFLPITNETIEGLTKKADGTSDAQKPAALFSFMIERLKKAQEKQEPFEQRLQRINLRLQTLHPELNLNFRVEGVSIMLEDLQGSAHLSLAEMIPVRRMKAVLAGLAVMHEELYACYPIFFVALKEMLLKKQEQAELLNFLFIHSSSWQSLVILDKAFFEYCIENADDGGDKGHPPVTVIDLETAII
jgi:hypothetical protein